MKFTIIIIPCKYQQWKIKFAEDTDTCNDSAGIRLPKVSYLAFDNGFTNKSLSHNPVVIRKNTLGYGSISETDAPSQTEIRRGIRWWRRVG